MLVSLVLVLTELHDRLVFHYTSEAGKLSPASTKEMHISTVGAIHCALTLAPADLATHV